MGKNKNSSSSSSSSTSTKNDAGKAAKDTGKYQPPNGGKGHKQKGAGAVISDRGPIERGGIILQSYQRLPSQLIHEFCQREKRPRPMWFSSTDRRGCFVELLLKDEKKSTKDLRFKPIVGSETNDIAKENAALLGLLALQRNLPLERKLPEPYRSTWLMSVSSSSSNSVDATKGPHTSNDAQDPKKGKNKGNSLSGNFNSDKNNNAEKSENQTREKEGKNESNQLSKMDSYGSKYETTVSGSHRKRQHSSGGNPSSLISSNSSSMASNAQGIVLESKYKFSSKEERQKEREAKELARKERERRRAAIESANLPVKLYMADNVKIAIEECLGIIPGVLDRDLGKNADEVKIEDSEFQINFSKADWEVVKRVEAMEFDKRYITQAIFSMKKQGQKIRPLKVLDYLLVNLKDEQLPKKYDTRSSIDLIKSKLSSKVTNDAMQTSSSTDVSGIGQSMGNERNGARQCDVGQLRENQTDMMWETNNKLEETLQGYGFRKEEVEAASSYLSEQNIDGTDEFKIYMATLFLCKIIDERYETDLSISSSLPAEVIENFLNEEGLEREDILNEIESEIDALRAIYGEENITQTSVVPFGSKVRVDVTNLIEDIDRIDSKIYIDFYISDNLTYPHMKTCSGFIFSKTLALIGNLINFQIEFHRYLSTLHGHPIICDAVSWVQEHYQHYTSSFNNSTFRKRIPSLAISEEVEKEIQSIPPSSASLESVLASNSKTKGEDEGSESVSLSSTETASTRPLSVKSGTKSELPAKDFQKASYTKDKSRRQSIPKVSSSFWDLEPVMYSNNQLKQKEEERLRNEGLIPNCNASRVRKTLPAASEKENIIKAFQSGRVLLITGETGCGKTTQCPQFLLENADELGKGSSTRVVVCQPRRIAAIGVANRVAEERGEKVGESVGYAIKGESKINARKTRLLFCTTAVVLRRMIDDPGLSGINYVVIDEVHERSVDSDLLMALLKPAMDLNRSLKVILMSATIDAERIMKYFSNFSNVGDCPRIHIPGFTFPVTDLYLEDTLRQLGRGSTADYFDAKDQEYSKMVQSRRKQSRGQNKALDKNLIDYDLIDQLVYYITTNATFAHTYGIQEGSILIFMPGVGEITKLEKLLVQNSSNLVIPLHGALSGEDQGKIFRSPPRGKRKIVIATNVAETSITIPDCTVVIDSCRVKQIGFDPSRNMASALVEDYASQDSIRQRRGRAGRTQSGVAFHMITKRKLERLPAHTLPEILRISLEQLILQICSMNLSPASFLPTLLDTPHKLMTSASIQMLVDLGGIDTDHKILPLGKHLATLPCPVRIGKMIIFGAMLGVLDPILSIAATLICRSPFSSSMDDEKRSLVRDTKQRLRRKTKLNSDHIIYALVYSEWSNAGNTGGERAKRKYSDENGILHDRMRDIQQCRKDLMKGLTDLGFQEVDEHANIRNALAGLQSVDSEGSLKEIDSRIVASADILEEPSYFWRVVISVITLGLYPQVVKIKRPPAQYQQMISGAFAKEYNSKELKMFVRKDKEDKVSTYLTMLQSNDSTNAPKDSKTDGASSVSSNAKNVLLTENTVDNSKLETLNNDDDEDDYKSDVEIDLLDSSKADILTSQNYPRGKGQLGLNPSDVEKLELKRLGYQEEDRIFIHPSSVNMEKGSFYCPWLVYNDLVETSKAYIRDSTEAPPYSLLFAARKVRYFHELSILLLDDWIKFQAKGRISALVNALKDKVQELLDVKMQDPSFDIASTDEVRVLIMILASNGMLRV